MVHLEDIEQAVTAAQILVEALVVVTFKVQLVEQAAQV
jgi:hypothetical protein